jgi:hypothetical protein
LLVPAGEPPVLDGTLSPGEWDGAAVATMDDGTDLLWLHGDGSLYVGFRHDRVGAVNLLVDDGERVRVLHSSAALGSAIHLPAGDGTWALDQDFDWCCRNVSDTEGLDGLWDDEGWVATIGYAGERGEVEFRVLLGEGDLRVAVSYVVTLDEVGFWPAGLPPEAREPLYGVREDVEVFTPDLWVPLVVGG